jgi:hypothetical protein
VQNEEHKGKVAVRRQTQMERLGYSMYQMYKKKLKKKNYYT